MLAGRAKTYTHTLSGLVACDSWTICKSLSLAMVGSFEVEHRSPIARWAAAARFGCDCDTHKPAVPAESKGLWVSMRILTVELVSVSLSPVLVVTIRVEVANGLVISY